tara:strand:+ start:20358 stop:21050 length:693 start_codon:yes stop_codon:yes gene_type:complete
MKWLLPILIIPFLFGSCAKDITPSADIPKPPVVQQSAKPDLDKTAENLDVSLEGNTLIDESIKDQIQALINQKKNISQALLQAEKLKIKAEAKVIITEIDIKNIIDELEKVESRNIFLEIESTKQSDIVKKQKIDLKTAKGNLKTATDKADKKEEEAKEAQDKLAQVSTSLTTKNGEVKSLTKALAKEKVKSAKSEVYRNWIWGLAGLFTLYTIIKNILMVYLPGVKFRI